MVGCMVACQAVVVMFSTVRCVHACACFMCVQAVSGLDASALLPSSIDAHGRRAAAAAAAAASRALTAQRPPAPRLPSAAPPPRLAGEEIGLFDTAQLTHTTDAPSVNWPPAAGNVDGIAASGMAVPPGPEDAGRRVTIGAAVNKRASQVRSLSTHGCLCDTWMWDACMGCHASCEHHVSI